MPNYIKETIIQKVYDLLKNTIPIVNKFPRNHKFMLGDKIQHQLTNLLENTITAYYAPRNEKKQLLKNINIQLEILRHYFRLCFDLGLYSSKKYYHFAEAINEIGKIIGGWLKSLN